MRGEKVIKLAKMEAKKAKVDVEEANMEVEKVDELSADPLPFARSYQLEALEKAIRQNTIVFLETGSGKTLIAIMLLRSYAYLLQKPSPFVAVFLVPKVVLVTQQAEAVKMHTDLKVGMYWGEMGVDCWDAAIWKQEMDNYEVLVMTPAILLRGLRHSFFKLNMIKLLIIDECHHARGNDSYACIMREFYHSQLKSGICNLPRIFGMTASPIKTKGAKSSSSYWKRIHELETLMNSKVYTCVSESVLAEFIPFSTTKFKYYQHVGIPYALHECMANELKSLQAKHECSLKNLDLDKSLEESIRKKMSKIFNTLIYCLEELGAWLALRAAESLSSNESDFFSWGMLDVYSEKFVKNFILDAFQAFAAYIPSEWTIASNVKADLKAGFLTTKVDCLIESLLEYSNLKDVRCIIFVERVITAVVLQSLLTELLPKYNSWKTKYIAGNNSGLHCQTRKKQNKIVEEFRRGMVNIIVATSILEEGLDVQSCNLVIRFDPSATVCSFIQSRGRARVQNSDYVLMVERGDLSTSSRLESYLKSGDMMREESLRHASSPCSPLKDDLCDEEVYHVESTGAIVTLSSSVGLLYFYCSRLPSDGYFKPAPKCDISKETGSCTLHLPKSCPIQTVCVQGNTKTLKQTACLEACRQLHKVGALTDNLVPDIVVEEAAAQEIGNKIYFDEQPIYFPPELVGQQISMFKYHCYLMELKQSFDHDTPVHNVVLGLRSELESDIGSMGFEFEVDGGILSVTMKYGGVIHLNPEEVLLCRRFQVTIFRVLMKRSLDKLTEILDGLQLRNEIELDYLLLPSNSLPQESLFDWKTVESVMFPSCDVWNGHEICSMKSTARIIHAKNGLICTCMIKNSLVYTPHNGLVYCITGIFDDLDANSPLRQRDGSFVTYKNYFEKRHGIQLSFVKEPLLKARQMFLVQNYLLGRRKQKAAESSRAYVELPPELCYIIMSPISASTLYTYTFIPSIMHRLESLLIAVNLKKMHLDHCMQNVFIPPMKILEAITTKECQEKFHMESLETLGDSFLKYAASQQLFKTHQNNHEGLLSLKKDKIISNASLRRLGCDRKLLGFIHNVSFDPKTWMVPGENSENCALTAEFLSDTRKIYVKGSRKIKSKRIADTVEALIGAHLSAGGESAALVFMDWIGIKVDFVNIPYKREFVAQAERFVNIRRIESLLNYSFNDPSLLVEALTHGSYMLPEISRCYQRLEFLGDSVVDYLITLHLHNKYPGITPGLLTDMRSASVNNECYALSAVKAGLHKHILHASHDLHKHIVATVKNFENLSSESTFGWEFEASFPKVLGDVIESLAGAILVDSGYNKDIVFASIRPLLEPLVTPETLRLHPSRELDHFCRKHNFDMGKLIYSHTDGMAAATVEVKANGITFKKTSTAANKEIAKKLVCKEVLKVLKESVSET